MRAEWTQQTDPQLLAGCDVDTYRASGPGGQKRNKTSSAVRLRHRATGLLVIAEESRSQHENKAKALQRIRRALYLELREPFSPDRPEIVAARTGDGRLDVRPKDARFWPAVAVALDALVHSQAQVSTAAEHLGVSTANLVGFLQQDPTVWQMVNRYRAQAGLKPLRAG